MDEVVAENARRLALLERDSYDQLTGEGCCGERVEVDGCRIPVAVLARYPDYASLPPLEQE